MSEKMGANILYFLSFAFISSISCAAGFDCAKARTDVEKVICNDSTLSALDAELASVYSQAKNGRPDIVGLQKEWIKKRNKCKDVECLRAEYNDQLGLLIKQAKDISPNQDNSSTSSSPDSAHSGDASNAPPLDTESAPLSSSEVQSTQPVLSTEQTESGQDVSAQSFPSSTPEPEHASTPNQVGIDQPTSINGTQPQDGNNYLLWVLGGVAIIIGYLIIGKIHQCPKCKKMYASKEVDRKLIDRRNGFKTVKREEKHKDINGNLIKTVERDEQIQVVNSTYSVTNKCKFCGHEWATTETKESS